MLNNLVPTITRTIFRTGLILSKHYPTIAITAGIGGGILASVLACKATLKVEKVLNDHKDMMSIIDQTWEKVKEGDIPLDDYSEEEDKKKAQLITTVNTAKNLVTLYGPSLIVGGISVALLINGHKVLTGRNVALMSAFKLADEAFKRYRSRVVDEYGEKIDYAFKNNLKVVNVNEKEINEKGEEVETTKEILVAEKPNEYSQYARFFDESCDQFKKNPEYNLMFLRNQQNYFNDLLRIRGNVFLNEVYDALGIPRTQAGAIVGWVSKPKNKNSNNNIRDNYIDFGIFNSHKSGARDFVNGYEPVILLDFNVDGAIYNLI